MQDADASVPALAADADEFVAAALEPGRHHAAVVVPDRAEALPVARVAPHGPVLDKLADREPILPLRLSHWVRLRPARLGSSYAQAQAERDRRAAMAAQIRRVPRSPPSRRS